ncbi:MAG: NUDIX hydrolase [Butyrivibrio sp.]|nr:NUDIX hydrolase [Butyrivibrio sp.]
MKGPVITRDKVETILDKKFIRVFDLQHSEGKHYFDATRRSLDNLVAIKTEEEFKKMLPDAVSCTVIVELPNEEPKLLLSYEYRYPAGKFLLGVPAGLLDPEDQNAENPLFATAIREIKEETGITFDPGRDSIEVINPLVFSTPGMTDESNGLVKVVLRPDDLGELSQEGAEGQECFDGFALVSKSKAREILKNGVDEHGHFYSAYTWAALMIFVTDMWG